MTTTTQSQVFKLFGKEYPKAPRVPSQPTNHPSSNVLPSITSNEGGKYPTSSQSPKPPEVDQVLQDTPSRQASPCLPAHSPPSLASSEEIQAPLSDQRSSQAPNEPKSEAPLTSAPTSPYPFLPFLPPDSPPPLPPFSPTFSHSPRPYQSVSVLYQPSPSSKPSKLSRSLPLLPFPSSQPQSSSQPLINTVKSELQETHEYPIQPPPSSPQLQHPLPAQVNIQPTQPRSHSPSILPPPASGTQLRLAIMQKKALHSIAQALDSIRTQKDVASTNPSAQPFQYVNSTTLSLPHKRYLDFPTNNREHKVPRVEQRVPPQSEPSQSPPYQNAEVSRTVSYSNLRDLPNPSNKPLRNTSASVPNEASLRSTASFPTLCPESSPLSSLSLLANVLRNRLLDSASIDDSLPSNLSNSLTLTMRMPMRSADSPELLSAKSPIVPTCEDAPIHKPASEIEGGESSAQPVNHEQTTQSAQWATKWASSWAAMRANHPQSTERPAQAQSSPPQTTAQQVHSTTRPITPAPQFSVTQLSSTNLQPRQPLVTCNQHTSEKPVQTSHISTEQLQRSFQWGEWVATQRDHTVQWKKCDHHRGAPYPIPAQRQLEPQQPSLSQSQPIYGAKPQFLQQPLSQSQPLWNTSTLQSQSSLQASQSQPIKARLPQLSRPRPHRHKSPPKHAPTSTSDPLLPHPLLRASSCSSMSQSDKKQHTYANGSDKNNTRDFRRDFHKMLLTEGEKVKKQWQGFHQSKQCTIARAPCIKVYREFCALVGGAFEGLAVTSNFSKLGTQTMCQCKSRLFLPYNS